MLKQKSACPRGQLATASQPAMQPAQLRLKPAHMTLIVALWMDKCGTLLKFEAPHRSSMIWFVNLENLAVEDLSENDL